MRTNFIIIIVVIFFISCKNGKSKFVLNQKSESSLSSQKLNCDDMPEYFDDFDEVIYYLDMLDWEYSEAVKISKGWILSAEYYSCDGEVGYFNICSTNKCYVHDYLEKNVWNKFINSENPGAYYQYYLKGKYQMYDRVDNHN